jgi:hypothetical protein
MPEKEEESMRWHDLGRGRCLSTLLDWLESVLGGARGAR